MKALLIVRPSALEDFSKLYGEAEGLDLAHAMFETMENFDGPVYVMDYETNTSSEIYDGFRNAIRFMRLRKDIRPLFISRYESWPDALANTALTLIREGVDGIVLGGVWFDPDMEFGCTTDAYNTISAWMPVDVDPFIVGCVPAN